LGKTRGVPRTKYRVKGKCNEIQSGFAKGGVKKRVAGDRTEIRGRVADTPLHTRYALRAWQAGWKRGTGAETVFPEK